MLESSGGSQRCVVADRLVALAAAGQETAGRRDRPRTPSLPGRVSGCSSEPYPVALRGLDGLLAGRRARTHAVGVLAVRGVSVGLAARSRAGLDLVRVLTHRRLSRLPREGEGARPAGWGARHGAPEPGSGLVARAGRGRRQGVLAKGRSGHGWGHGGHGSGPWFGSGCGGQGPDGGTGDGGNGAGGCRGLSLVLWGLDGALALRATHWRGQGRSVMSKQISQLRHNCHHWSKSSNVQTQASPAPHSSDQLHNHSIKNGIK